MHRDDLVILCDFTGALLSMYLPFAARPDSSNSSEANDAYILHSASSSSIEYSTISYDRLCLCTGVRPRLIAPHPNIIGLRDSHSLNELVRRLSGARRVLVVGNGGIALELVHEVRIVKNGEGAYCFQYWYFVYG